MPFACALSTHADSHEALVEVLGQVADFGAVDLAIVFFNPRHRPHLGEWGKTLYDTLEPLCLLGCPGETIIGNDREIEDGPALSLWLGRWNETPKLTTLHLTFEQTPEGFVILGWPDGWDEVDPAKSSMLLLADPFSFPVDDFFAAINDDKPGLRVMGGMASGARQPGQNLLFQDGVIRPIGAVGVLIEDSAPIRSVVSQGCRPIGRPMVITKAKDNAILELGGKVPLTLLQEIWQELSPDDQELVQKGLHVGRVINEYQADFQRGDFLIRNVMGIDRQTGAVLITDRVRPGQTVQFHVRDALTADEDLKTLLQIDRAAQEKSPAGALLFSCNGRGSRLFDVPDHDARMVRKLMGAIPLAGFFAQGELGPVGGQNFIHGFTASVVLFED